MVQFDFTKSKLSDEELRQHPSKDFSKEGWWELVFKPQNLDLIQREAAKVQEQFENLVVIGIGGSSQGLKALSQAVSSDKPKVKLYVLETPDPKGVRRFCGGIDLDRTCFNIISKSGETIETLTLFEYFRPKLKKEQIIITSGKKWEDATFFEIPKNVPGRFSVFSAVGLFPLACVGVDIAKLLEGARQVNQENAFKNGLLHYLLYKNHGKTISVMMPYTDSLEEFGKWYVQLWAESLGKEGKGQTPMVAVGPQAQHSIAQLILDGPQDKMVTFIKVKGQKEDPFGKLLERECDATAQAFFEKGIPSVTITLPAFDAETMGELLMSYQLQTAFVGHLMGIDPYSQPAVERIKKLLSSSF